MKANRTARSRCAVLLTAVLLTSACASIPDLGPQPEPRAATDFASSKAFAAPRSEWPADGWWRRYGDPQLAQLMEQGLAELPISRPPRRRLRAAEGFAQRAGAALSRQVDAFAAAGTFRSRARTPRRPLQPFPMAGTIAARRASTFSLDLDLWGKNRAASRAARPKPMLPATSSTRRGWRSPRASLPPMPNWLRSMLSATASSMRSTSAPKSAKLVKQRVDIGLDTQAEPGRRQRAVAQARADIEATDEAIELTKNALAELVGAGPDRALSIGRPAIALLQAQGIPADASTNLVGRRPDIAALALAGGSGRPANQGRARLLLSERQSDAL